MSGGKSEGDPMWTIVWAVVVGFGLFAFLWFLFKHPILEFLRWMRFAEVWVISLFTDSLNGCADWLRLVHFNATTMSPELRDATMACFSPEELAGGHPADYYNLTATSVNSIEQRVTPYIRWPFIATFIAFAYYILYVFPRNKFKTKHTLESFIGVQAKMWPAISPILHFNPASVSARSPGQAVPDKIPPFAEAFSPEEWVAWHRIAVRNGIPDREAARRAFMLQLGPRWKSVEDMPFYMQALFAAFALKGAQRREESEALLGKISLCWTHKGGLKWNPELLSEVKKILRDPALMKEAVAIANEHAYRTTAILGVLKWARSMGGVLAPAHFLWLRAVDRALWYPLNNLGRRSFHTEGAGAMAHFMAEQAAKKPLPIPRIDTAVVTLNQYLAAHGQPIPPREGNGVKAKG